MVVMEAHQEVGFGVMGRDAKRKLRNDNDIKILVVGMNSQTGIGKSTFAVELCRFIDDTDSGWNAEEKAFIDVPEYIDAHLNKPKQSCLMLDEIEAGADSRRAMSHENVNLSQAWMTMRARNIATVATLPTTDALDNRMLSLADYWVLVRKRGVAQPYRVVVNDFNGKVQREPVRDGELIQFPDLPSDDPDKAYLDDIKDNMLEGLTEDSQKVPMKKHKKKLEKAREEARKEKRNELIRELYDDTEYTTGDIADFDWAGVSQSMVSHVLNSD